MISLYLDLTFFSTNVAKKKPILLDQPKITSTYAEIKRKHKCVGRVTFISWECCHYVGEEEIWEEEEKKYEEEIFSLWFFLFRK